MSSVSIRELSRNAAGVVEEVERTGKPALVTRHGKPVAVLLALNAEDLEDYVLTHAPAYVRGRAEAERELVGGETQSLSQFLSELESEPNQDARSRGEPR